jgi:hypothetical protein
MSRLPGPHIVALVLVLIGAGAALLLEHRYRARVEKAQTALDSIQSVRNENASRSRALVRDSLPLAQARWLLAEPGEYRLLVQHSFAFGRLPWAEVRVRADTVVSVTDSVGAQYPGELRHVAVTVPSLFLRLCNLASDSAWHVTAQFDSVRGYPTSIGAEHVSVADMGSQISVVAVIPQ